MDSAPPARPVETVPSLAVEAQGPPQLDFEPFVPWPLVLVVAAGVLLLAVRSYARTTRPLPLARKALLWILRGAAVLAVVTCLLRPVLIQPAVWREKGLCFLVLDASASMNLRDAPQARTRWEFAGELLAAHRAELAALGQRYEVRRFLFDVTPVAAARLPGEDAGPAPARATGRATDLAAVLQRLAVEAAGSPCAGVLLISDGRHNLPRDPLPGAAALADAGAPLFIVGVGEEATPPGYCEVQVRIVEVPERAFVQSEVRLGLEVESQLPAPARVPLTITVNGETIRQETLALPAGREVTQVEARYTPTALGAHRVVATAKAAPEEANVENNVAAAYFRVFRSRLGLWYVEGAIRKEFGALRSALETAPHLSVYALNAFAASTSPDPELLPRTEEAWKDLRLVILGDLPASRFRPEQLERLAQFVEKGGAVLMLGGSSNFGAGGWQNTPLAGVLPVELSGADGAVDGPLAISLTTDGAAHPAARLSADPALSKPLWSQLPPLPGINAVKALKPAARVLLRAGAHPLLVVQDYGQGRSAVFTGDATWQWALKARQGDAQKFFWRNLATWLMRSDYRDAGKVVTVETDHLQYLLGDEALLSAQVQATESTQGQLETARVVATLEKDGGPRLTWELGRGPGEYSARQTPPQPGSYTYRVEVLAAGGAVLGRDSMGLQVDVVDVENDNPKANPRLLRALAARSGGVFYDAGHAGEALAQLLRGPAGFSKSVRESTELWNHWGLFAVFALLLTLEWALRKRWGLV